MASVRKFFKKYGWSYLFVLPAMTTFTIFTLIPVLRAFIISFQKYSLVRGGTFVNPIFANYTRAFTMFGGIFTTAIKNTIVYALFTVTTAILLGLILASLIQPLSNKMRTFFRGGVLPASGDQRPDRRHDLGLCLQRPVGLRQLLCCGSSDCRPCAGCRTPISRSAA